MGNGCSKGSTNTNTKKKAMRSMAYEIAVAPLKVDSCPLYIVLPYFNYCGFARRKELFLEFVERYKGLGHCNIVVVEATVKGTPFHLPPLSGGNILLHIKVELVDRVWIKENLINIAVKHLPKDWYYLAWIDADITFLNNHWVGDTIQLLKSCDVVQLFHTAINMGPDNEALKIDKSFVYMNNKSGRPYHKNAKYGFWHTGFAWACNKHAYTQMNGLLDFAILGSGDRHMALALAGLAEYSYHGGVHDSYKRKVLEFQKRCKGLKIDYVNGTILHHFHGSQADRKYADRWNILVEHKYDVDKDIYYESNGLLKLTENGKRLQKDMDDYFKGRKEDGKVA